jgi:peptidoglycan/LPS O-acetylase OafA/YrhL
MLVEGFVKISNRRRGMGCIRFLLAIAVLLWHCPVGILPRFLFPTLAVQCFYAVSGFLIQMVIREKYQGRQHWQTRFYVSRILRIYPLYLLFFLLTALLVYNSFSYYTEHRKWSAGLLWIANNFLIVGQDVLRFFYFSDGRGDLMLLPADGGERAQVYSHGLAVQMTVLGQSWTLAIELYFYLLAPFLLMRATRTLVAGVAALIGLRLVLGYSFASRPELVYGFFPTELAVFLLGALAYRAYSYFFASGRLVRALESTGTGEKTLALLSTLAVGGGCWVYMTCDLNFVSNYAPPLAGRWGAPLGAPAGYWLILIMTAALLPFAFHFSHTFGFDRYVGELSYPIYISHFLVLQLVTGRLHPAEDAKDYICVFVLGISVLLSMVLIDFVEKPIDRLRHRLARVGE